MFNDSELETVRYHGGRMHREEMGAGDIRQAGSRPRLLLNDSSNELGEHVLQGLEGVSNNGKLAGVYEHVSSTPIRYQAAFCWWMALISDVVAAVSSHSTGSITSNSLHLCFSPRARYPSVSVPLPHRWLTSRPGWTCKCTHCRPGCYREGTMALYSTRK